VPPAQAPGFPGTRACRKAPRRNRRQPSPAGSTASIVSPAEDEDEEEEAVAAARGPGAHPARDVASTSIAPTRPNVPNVPKVPKAGNAPCEMGSPAFRLERKRTAENARNAGLSVRARALHERSAMIDSASSPDIFRERLRELCLCHYGIVRQACRRYVQNPDDADDLAQEVLLKAARAWDAFQGDCAAPTWLYRVARNHCADFLRRGRRYRERMRLYAAGEEPEEPDAFPEVVPTGLTFVLEELQNGLDCVDRHIAYLRFEVGMKQVGIARITGMTKGCVAGRLRRIRERAVRLYGMERKLRQPGFA
jgi:RNA polymerase sigma-70 factor (ECF subfamily)